MKKYFGKFASSGDVQTALDGLQLVNPYVAVVENDTMDYDNKEPDYTKMPLTFEILSDGIITWTCDIDRDFYKRTIEYSKNGGAWVPITSDATINVNNGDIVQFRGDNDTYGSSSYCNSFKGTANFNAMGNIMSLISSTGFTTATAFTREHVFRKLFYGATKLLDASKLILPVTVLTSSCYKEMFEICSNLTAAPELPATTLSNQSYNYMFGYCGKLNHIKCMATDISADACTTFWVYNVSATGTFVKKAGASWTSGNDGIPNGWTVIEE